MVERPDVPHERLTADGWERIEESESVVFEMPPVTVAARTVVYDDVGLRESVRAAAPDAPDRSWRFLFAGALSIRPSLPTGIGRRVVTPMVEMAARERFVEDLRDRGLASVEGDRRERVRVATGERVTCRGFTATLSLDGARDVALPVEGWVGTWPRGDGFRVAGGAHPASSLDEVVGGAVDYDPATARRDCFEFVHAVA
ncbi:MAG: hypothetical protein ABEJ70_03820 [Halobacteriaceae archaeon]